MTKFNDFLETISNKDYKQEKDSNRILKGVAYFDSHIPKHINHEPFIRFLKDFEPDYVINGGDFMDFDGISHWNTLKPKEVEGKRLVKDIETANNILDKIDDAVGEDCKKIFLKGNHEDWLDQHITKFPYLEGSLNVDSLLKLEDRGYIVKELNETYRLGKLYITHGMYATQHHAKKHSDNFKSSVMYGHVHGFQTFISKSMVSDNKIYGGFAIGCMSSKDMAYNKRRPHSWDNGFAVIYVDSKTGRFNIYPVMIIKGKFIAPNGKVYR